MQERRFTPIMFTDTIGYTTEMRLDEDRTIEILGKVKKHKGFFDENSIPGMFSNSNTKSKIEKDPSPKGKDLLFVFISICSMDYIITNIFINLSFLLIAVRVGF